MSKVRPYRCPGCDREAFIWVQRTTLHRFGNNGLVYTISCDRDGDNSHHCLGQWFRLRPFTCETNAISAWNEAIIEMGAAAVGITPREALALKEGRMVLSERPSIPELGERP